MRSILLLSTEASLSNSSASATTVNSALCVRVVNTNASSAIVYRLASVSGTVLGSCSVMPYQPIYLYKDPTDCLYASAASVLQAAAVKFIE